MLLYYYYWNPIIKRFLVIFRSCVFVASTGLFGLCIGLASVAVLYEGLHVLKTFLLARFIQTRKVIRLARSSRESSSSSSSSPRNRVDGRPTSLLEETQSDEPLGAVHSSLLPFVSSGFIDLSISSVLHALYITLGFTLMNAVMTFNIWITFAICLGVGIGYFFFGNFRRTDAFIVPLTKTTRTLVSSSRDISEEGGGGDQKLPQRKVFNRRNQLHVPSGGGDNGPDGEEEEHSQLIVGAQVHSPQILPSTST